MILFDSRADFSAPNFDASAFAEKINSQSIYSNFDQNLVLLVQLTEVDQDSNASSCCVTTYTANDKLSPKPFELNEQALELYYTAQDVFICTEQEEFNKYVAEQMKMYSKYYSKQPVRVC